MQQGEGRCAERHYGAVASIQVSSGAESAGDGAFGNELLALYGPRVAQDAGTGGAVPDATDGDGGSLLVGLRR